MQNEWEEEEGTYHIRQQNLLVLHQDFTLVCRIGGEFAAGIDDPSEVLFRYVNCLHFIGEGKMTLSMFDVDMMRRYAGSFDSEDFSITFGCKL